MTIRLPVIATMALYSLAGCTHNPANYPDTAPVTGTVTLDGQPLEGATVNFKPGGGGRPSRGITDADGNYELMYSGTVQGAMLGTHTVSILKEEDPQDEEADTVQVVPERYFGKDSELSAEVENAKNSIDFDLKSE